MKLFDVLRRKPQQDQYVVLVFHRSDGIIVKTIGPLSYADACQLNGSPEFRFYGTQISKLVSPKGDASPC